MDSRRSSSVFRPEKLHARRRAKAALSFRAVCMRLRLDSHVEFCNLLLITYPLQGHPTHLFLLRERGDALESRFVDVGLD